jgi:hypothetical protein
MAEPPIAYVSYSRSRALSEQREESRRAPLLTATKITLQKGKEQLELINLLMTERPKIRPVRNVLKRRIDEIFGPRKIEKGMEQG